MQKNKVTVARPTSCKHPVTVWAMPRTSWTVWLLLPCPVSEETSSSCSVMMPKTSWKHGVNKPNATRPRSPPSRAARKTPHNFIGQHRHIPVELLPTSQRKEMPMTYNAQSIVRLYKQKFTIRLGRSILTIPTILTYQCSDGESPPIQTDYVLTPCPLDCQRTRNFSSALAFPLLSAPGHSFRRYIS